MYRILSAAFLTMFLAFCFSWFILSSPLFSRDYVAGLEAGRMQARTEAVLILRNEDRSGIMAAHYVQALLKKYGLQTRLFIEQQYDTKVPIYGFN